MELVDLEETVLDLNENVIYALMFPPSLEKQM